MSRRLWVVLWFSLWCCSQNIYAQRLGLLPAKTKWHQLINDSLRIIYPEGHEETARRTASIMLQVGSADPISCNCRYKPISVLLQPQTNIANGYVGLAPYMSEFYLQPHENPFRLGSLPWADLLAIHETRHVQQLNAANTGWSNVIKRIFGDYVFTGAYNLSIPNWYREGDAVYAETKFTRQGRGRLSLFTLPFREKMKEGKPWEYYLVRNGSYRQYTPDHYPLGYLIVQYGNHVFGESTWDTIVKRAPRFEHLFGPFSGVVRENAGLRNRPFYEQAMAWYGQQWEAMSVPEVVYPEIPLPDRDQKQTYYDLSYPVADGDGSIYATLTTFDRTAAIYQFFPEGKKKKIISLGLQQDPFFSFRNDVFVWTELRLDARWIRRDKNVIVVYTPDTGRKISITPDKGYFMPSLDETGRKIVALHTDEMGKHQLHLLDAFSGSVLDTLPNPDNLYLGYPVFAQDGKSIISTARNHEGRMCLIEQDITSGEFRRITHYSYAVLGRPVIQDPWIFLAAGWDQLDQVYAVDRAEGIFYKISEGNRAHYDAAWDPITEEIIAAQYRLDGKKLVRLPGSPQRWTMINMDDGVKDIPGASTRDLIAEDPQGSLFETKPYSPWANALNVHSWTLTADDPNWGVQVRSDNILNSISMTGGYEFNRNSSAGGPYFDVRLGMWLPEITLGISRTSREFKTSEGDPFRIYNDRFRAGVALPLIFTPGAHRQALRISSDYVSGVSQAQPRLPQTGKFNFNYLTHRLVLINSRLMAYRPAMPLWAQRFDISYSHEVTGTPLSQLYTALDLALPSIWASHYVMLHSEYLTQDLREGSIQLGSNYIGARGFDFVEGETQYRFGITYGFPLWYPDKGFGNIFFTRRLRLQPFYDIAFTNDPRFTSASMSSAGAEVIVDFDFPPLSIGFRYARILTEVEGNVNRFQFFIPSQRF